MLADIEAGTVDAVICWHVDRLTRTPRELEDVIDLADRHGLELATVTGDIDLQTPTGRMVARQLGTVARYESEHKGHRQRTQIQQSAARGRQGSGSRRPYGYAPTYQVISGEGEKLRRRITSVSVDYFEGEIIKQCARRVLAGESISSITNDLNNSGVLTSEGNRWNRTTLRRLLCSARISGRREYVARNSYATTRALVGEIVSTTSDWPAIISAADSDRIRALLTRPDRRTTTGGARTRLLSGILHCGRCERPLVGRSQRGKPIYCCNRDTGGCGGLSITAEPTDDHIRDLVLTALDSPELVARLRHRDQPESDLHARIRADEDELTLWAADLGNGRVSRMEWTAATTPIRARLEAARAQLAASTQTSALEGFVGNQQDMTIRWENFNTSQRRAVVTAVLGQMTVHPATVMGRNRFDSDRLEPVWRA